MPWRPAATRPSEGKGLSGDLHLQGADSAGRDPPGPDGGRRHDERRLPAQAAGASGHRRKGAGRRPEGHPRALQEGQAWRPGRLQPAVRYHDQRRAADRARPLRPLRADGKPEATRGGHRRPQGRRGRSRPLRGPRESPQGLQQALRRDGPRWRDRGYPRRRAPAHRRPAGGRPGAKAQGEERHDLPDDSPLPGDPRGSRWASPTS